MILFTFIDIQRWRVYFYNIKLVLDYINKFITVKIQLRKCFNMLKINLRGVSALFQGKIATE